MRPEAPDRDIAKIVAVDPDRPRRDVPKPRDQAHQSGLATPVGTNQSDRNAETRRLLASTCAATGDFERALTILRAWLEDEPANASARHLVAAISGEDVPARASDRYVETMFDSFADSFDGKLARLDYRAPELVGGAVAMACGMPDRTLDILDAGCGTGLCGPYLRPLARRLVGVDLSGGMLARASHRGDYTELTQAELTGFLCDHPAAFDLIVSADTLCYFGALDDVLSGAAVALRRPGVLVFTVEANLGPEPHRLNPHGRYSHEEDYVSRAMREAGFVWNEIRHDQLRVERGEPVAGFVVTGRL